jgi:hypothetical protein
LKNQALNGPQARLTGHPPQTARYADALVYIVKNLLETTGSTICGTGPSWQAISPGPKFH